jgi:hypothetical protein
MGGQFGAKGIAFDGFTLTNSWIHNGSDCVHMGDTVTIRDTLCAVGPDINNDGFADNTSWCNLGDFHRDGFQSNAGGPYVIDHNVVRNNCGETSAISIFQDFGASHDIQIKNNLLAGGGYTLYCGEPATNEAVTNNRFSRQFFPNSGFFGPTKACPAPGTGNSFTGNVWDDTGAPLGEPELRNGNSARSVQLWRRHHGHRQSSVRDRQHERESAGPVLHVRRLQRHADERLDAERRDGTAGLPRQLPVVEDFRRRDDPVVHDRLGGGLGVGADGVLRRPRHPVRHLRGHPHQLDGQQLRHGSDHAHGRQPIDRHEHRHQR